VLHPQCGAIVYLEDTTARHSLIKKATHRDLGGGAGFRFYPESSHRRLFAEQTTPHMDHVLELESVEFIAGVDEGAVVFVEWHRLGSIMDGSG